MNLCLPAYNRTLTIAAAVWLLIMSAAFNSVQAQGTDDDDGITGEIVGQSQTQSAYQISRAVSWIVGNRVGPISGPPQVTPTPYTPSGLSDDPAANAIVNEAVSTATNDPAMIWNAWVDATFIQTDRDRPGFSYDGPMVTTSVGLDRTIGTSTVVGVLVNYEYLDFDTKVAGFSGSLQSDSVGIGVYAGTALTQNIVADAMFIYGWSDNDVVEIIGKNSFDSERMQAAANLTGYWFNEAWRYSPAIGVIWSSEDQDAYAFIPGRTLESGVATASLQIGRTHFYDDVRSIEPYVGVSAEWEFHSSGGSGGVPGGDLDPFDVRILAGINTQMSPAVSANVRADIAGLAREDYLVGSIGGQLAVRF